MPCLTVSNRLALQWRSVKLGQACPANWLLLIRGVHKRDENADIDIGSPQDSRLRISDGFQRKEDRCS
jgi:hypothetical protein